MGNPKQKWTTEEEEALRAGVAKYGPGKWKFIQKDPEFNQFLHSRSNIDLKDKWRNMSAAGQGSRDKLRTPKAKANPNLDVPTTPSVNVQTIPASAFVGKHELPADHAKDDAAKEFPDGKNGSRCNDMIFEALSAVKDPNGLDIGSIVAYIEQRLEVPQNFRKQLGAKLRRLVQQEKLEKVEGFYRIKNRSLVEANTNIRKDNAPMQPLSVAQMKAGESLEEAAKTAAYKVVEAENKSFVAAEAVKEAERISRMAEETDTILQLAKEIFQRCCQGEIALVA
uniref:MYB transcription factor n=1 Tax=Opuntia streptacantha TaxID=393608 RepID=A0A7C8ZI41_OPUST